MLSFYNTGSFKEKEIDHPKISRPPDSSDTARWRKEMSLIEVALIEAYAGKTMDIVGQTRRFRGPLIPYSLYYLLRPIQLLGKYAVIPWKRLLVTKAPSSS